MVALERRSASLDAELERLRARVATLEAELAQVRGSVSWQVFQSARSWFHRRTAHRPSVKRAVSRALIVAGRLNAARREKARASLPIVFPACDAPEVSVVMPVVTRADLTEASLRALRNTADHVPLEVVIVDDGADAATRALLGRLRGVRAVRNETRLAYLRSTNLGAAGARGRYLLLLNNDATPLPGAIEALVARAESSPAIGAVAPKYLDPDGALLEAGVIVWCDGEAAQFGHGDHPHLSRYEYSREVDSASAAALLVRRDAWSRLGGFDEHFEPMYWEDTDFCFRLREAGFRIHYEPRARVIHAEGSTAGTDETVGMKRNQEVNRLRFAQRWGERLADQPGREAVRARTASHRGRRAHVLVVDHKVPTPDRDSGSVRMLGVLDALVDLRCHVTFASLEQNFSSANAARLTGAGVELLRGDLAGLRVDLTDIGDDLNLAILSRPAVAALCTPMLRDLAPRARLAYDAVDLHWLRERRRGELEGNAADALAHSVEKIERAVIQASDVTICVSEREREMVMAEIPGTDTAVVSNVHRIPKAVPARAERRGLVFVGGFLHRPNADAALYLVREVMPLVWEQAGPDVPLTVVGPDPPQELSALASDRVRVVGWVEGVEDVLDGALALIAPLRYGAGVKGKITQSLSRGLPVVTTPVGAEGVAEEAEEPLLIGADAAELARQVCRLLEDPALWVRLSEKGRALVEERWSPGRARSELAALLGLSEPPDGSAVSVGPHGRVGVQARAGARLHPRPRQRRRA